MSLTALATAWSAYQSNIWNGIQVAALADSNEAETIAAKHLLQSNQHRMMDAYIVITISSALADGRKSTVDFLLSRLRDELRSPIAAWIAADPVHNASAVRSPLESAEYLQNVIGKYAEEQKRLLAVVEQRTGDARRAGRVGDNYVLLTVLFATVLFFGGIATTFRSPKVEAVLLAVATLILVGTLGALATFPVNLD